MSVLPEAFELGYLDFPPGCDGFIFQVPCAFPATSAAIHERSCRCRASWLLCETHRNQMSQQELEQPGRDWTCVRCEVSVGKLIRIVPL